MKREVHEDRRNRFFENARFFQYLPDRSRESLDEVQRRDIAHTIFELQRSNPRVLQELYLENPFLDREHPHKFWFYLKRRIFLSLRTAWFSLPLQKRERRASNALADYVFLIGIGFMASLALIGLFLILYGIKSMLGIDIFPNVHLFCR